MWRYLQVGGSTSRCSSASQPPRPVTVLPTVLAADGIRSEASEVRKRMPTLSGMTVLKYLTSSLGSHFSGNPEKHLQFVIIDFAGARGQFQPVSLSRST